MRLLTSGPGAKGAALAALALVVATALAVSTVGCGESPTADPPGLDGGPLDGTPADLPPGSDQPVPPPAGDPYEPAPVPAPMSPAALGALKDELDALLAKPAVIGSTHSILIVDGENDQVLYEWGATTALKPASNTKLFTSAAALELLNEDHRAEIRAYGPALGPGGQLAGDLHLVGEHYFTLSTYFYSDPRTPLDRLARALHAAGLRRVTGGVVAAGEYVYAGSSLGYYDDGAHRAATASAMRAALVAAGIEVAGAARAGGAIFAPPPGLVPLGAPRRALPLSVACSPLNRSSHNEYADILLRHVGLRIEGESSYAAGARAVIDWLGSIGSDATGVSLNDGSGLSHENRVTARQVIDLLRFMGGSPVGPFFRRTLSVAGVRGTLGARMTGADTRGRFWGKTGTLKDTIAASGYLMHRHDGRRYLVGALMNAVSDKASARATHDQIIAALARDRRGVGASRPSQPELLSVASDGNGATVSLAWTAVPGAEGYLVWLGDDGLSWDRARARLVRRTDYRAGELAGGQPVHVRVTAVGPGGVESAPSDTYATRVAAQPSRVLIVDGNDRWQAEPSPENVLGGAHGFAADLARALGSEPFDTIANEHLAAVDLARYAAVIWHLGEESEEHETFDGAEQAKVRSYLEGGGALLVSGAELGWDLGHAGSETDRAFLAGVLRAGFVADSAETYAASGAGGILAGVGELGFLTPDQIDVAFADQLSPGDGAVPILSYLGGAGGTAGLQHDGAYRLVVLGFPLVSVDSGEDRARVMGAALDFLLRR